ncbi:redoxin domain-containing protein [Bacillus sp. S/N-304-OC-R1]|uniref:redoxin domain-containing protein n=1 Tax=Bacillus sp. S/N-304-OC-R1 TaxID=2758034 RepID=UPI001C8DA274|nr:redoxin domain-containing protein [Bacillus sp. S/N-304-OC-R1]MBY0120524.1 redoxin domain-containing protein [Bacillus sp. S/N-304-OC-R1]
MIKKVISASFLFFLMAIVIVQAQGKEDSNNEQVPGIRVGLKAPDFELKDLDGKAVRLSDFKGKKVMLNFWATWCPPCKAEMPAMQKFFEESGDEIVILAVNIDPENNVAGFVKQMGVQFPVLLDKNEQVNSKYKILSIPTTFFIDENGIIKHKHLSVMTIDMMRKYSK